AGRAGRSRLAADSRIHLPLARGRGTGVRKKERAKKVGEILDRIYPQPDIPLQHRDPFTLLVAVVLSAQTTDAMVNRVTPALFAKAKTPTQMAALPLRTVLSLIRTCGLSQGKARNIKRLSEILVKEHSSTVPRDMEALERLPGVGHKTASVVMNQAFGVATFP